MRQGVKLDPRDRSSPLFPKEETGGCGGEFQKEYGSLGSSEGMSGIALNPRVQSLYGVCHSYHSEANNIFLKGEKDKATLSPD